MVIYQAMCTGDWHLKAEYFFIIKSITCTMKSCLREKICEVEPEKTDKRIYGE